jgi:hypothetical protein
VVEAGGQVCTARVRFYDSLLDTAGPAGTLAEFTLLDTERSPAYYPGRWVMPKRQSGRFVGRRPQAYGADLWCYMEVADGTVKRLLNSISSSALGNYRAMSIFGHLSGINLW